MWNAWDYIRKRYGRKQALLRHLWFGWQDRLGFFQGYRAVDWRRIDRLIFVCEGNICRSPYAEARAHSLGCRSASFGLRAGRGGDAAHATVCHLARQAGLDLREHRSRRPSDVEITAQDLLIGFEPWHAWELEMLSGTKGAQITLLGLWSAERRPHLEDPYGLRDSYFRTCMEVIESGVGAIARLCREQRVPFPENEQPSLSAK